MKSIRKLKESTNNFVSSWTKFVIKYKWSVLIGTFVLTLMLGLQGKMNFDGDYHVFFSKSNPELEAFDALQEKYTKDDNVILVLTPSNGDVFTKLNLVAIESLTSEAWNTPYSSRVDAVTNFQHTSAIGDELYVDDLSYNSIDKSELEIKGIKEIALKEPMLLNRLINTDGSVTAVNITVRLPGEDSAKEVPEVMEYVRNMVNQFKNKYPHFDVHVSGMVPLNTAFFEASMEDMALTAIMMLIAIITTFIFTRNIQATVSTLLVVLFSIVSAVGFVGLAGIKLTPPSSVFPTMILTLAIADSIHILITI